MIKKTTYFLLIATAFALLTSFYTNPGAEKQKPVIRTIIVDAGHGGSDNGARGDYSFEKDICLGVALKLGKKLEQEFPDVKILYTRTRDEYPSIKARADFANANKGDLFVSIHVNAGAKIRHSKFSGYKTEVYYTGKGKKRKKHTRKVPKYTYYFTDNPSNGTETYIWAADRADAKGEFVSERMTEEVNDSTEYAPDINDPEFKAKSLLWTKRYFDRSLMLATMVEEEFINGGRASRGVKQRNEKGIWVLQATAMPSILVETGFISHRPEEDYLNSSKGQEEVANNVLAAIKRYKSATEGNPEPKQGF
ncbi:N-acetylmuramoyl-L-alanine amidase [Paraflavitalea sp. CAU 1676]|uniref:N-acetylmuramoyl-L-alanine amidase family protein n=1 Tax=Paraflavitalea sp. CAU 1676 TaxID=3032598 RepID=UPI0023DA40CA|nr:N-acetylmuramoyl-L-alanine amidase [Paraflavitalea sp. CAU 1676]MDF2192819.1 N-acetylmuramoyl-L-alanine amidase [Paraflavitalea sp. CAU 1676]